MTSLDDHIRFEALMAIALRAPDPALAVEQLRRDAQLPAALRACLEGVDADGVRMSGLIIARLRFERLLHGSARAQQSFDEDTAAFAQAFRRYHQEVVPSAALPTDEAALFEAWLAEQEFGR